MEEVLNCISRLHEEFPEDLIKQREGRGGMMLDYLETPTVIRRLTEVFAHRWNFEVLDQNLIKEGEKLTFIVVKGRLTVTWPDEFISHYDAYGSSQVKYLKSGAMLEPGDDFKGAQSDCLKKCATMLGVGLFLYDKEKIEKKPISQQAGGYTPPAIKDLSTRTHTKPS